MLNTAHIRRAFESRQSVGVSYRDIYKFMYNSLSSEWPSHRPRGRRALVAPLRPPPLGRRLPITSRGTTGKVWAAPVTPRSPAPSSA